MAYWHGNYWVCKCNHSHNYYENYCSYCGDSTPPYNYSSPPFFSNTLSTYSYPREHTKKYERDSSEKSDSDNLSKSSKAELAKLKKKLGLLIQLVDKTEKKDGSRTEIKNTLTKVEGKIPKGDYDKTKELLDKLISALPNKNKTNELADIKYSQQLAGIEGQTSEDKELCEIIDLLTGTAILQTLDVEKTEEPKSEEKKGEKEKKDKKGEKDDNIPSDPQTLIEDISEQWEEGNFDSVQENLESLEKTKGLDKQGLKQNIPDLKKKLRSLIEKRKEIIRLINKIKSEKLKDEINISNKELTDDELLEELEVEDDD